VLNPRDDVSGNASTMVMQGPKGVVLQAIGSKQDHKVAGRLVTKIEKMAMKNKGPVKEQPPTPPRDRPSASGSTSLAKRDPEKGPSTTEWSFGAVYEHRDAFGKPKLIGSTDKLPERQFMLDNKQGVPSDMKQAVVWAGVSKMPADSMTEIRRGVADARSKRLEIDKLGSIKPYSHHGY